MVFYEGYSVNLDIVNLSSKLHALVLLASDDRTDIRTVNADNAVLHLLFLSQRILLAEHLFYGTQTLALLGSEHDVNGVYLADSVPLAYLLLKQAQQSPTEFVCGHLGVLTLLGIGKSGAVNVAILVTRQPFSLRFTSL